MHALVGRVEKLEVVCLCKHEGWLFLLLHYPGQAKPPICDEEFSESETCRIKRLQNSAGGHQGLKLEDSSSAQ